VRVLVLRIKRTQGIDASTAEVLVAQGLKMKERGQHLLLVGMEQKVLELLKRAGIHDALDEAQLFPTSGGVFEAASGAVRRAVELLDDPTIDDPLVRWAMNTNRKKS
ncbi:MAG: STAS domain-containing protein, partial [Myxococcota bacterium]